MYAELRPTPADRPERRLVQPAPPPRTPSSGCAATAAAPTATRSPARRAARTSSSRPTAPHLKVRVTGTNASGSRQLTSGASYDVDLGTRGDRDPLPNPDGGPAQSQAPSLAGDAYVGETLAGTVGGWKDPTTDFLRRWVRCDADGGSCTYIQQVASTDPEAGPTYIVRADDVGYTDRHLRVKADVNNDLTPDGLDNHLPHSVEVDTPPSAVITTGPSRPPPPPPGGGNQPDTAAPVLSALEADQDEVRRGQSRTTLQLRLSEPGTVRIVVARRSTAGARSGRAVQAAGRARTARASRVHVLQEGQVRDERSGTWPPATSPSPSRRRRARTSCRRAAIARP